MMINGLASTSNKNQLYMGNPAGNKQGDPAVETPPMVEVNPKLFLIEGELLVDLPALLV